MTGVQLRLGFDEPTSQTTLFLRASGLRVLVETRNGAANDAHAYLVAAGVEPEMTTASGIVFPLSRFRELANVSDNCTIIADPTLRPLLEWIEQPPADGFAAELELGADGTLWLTWNASHARLSEPLNAASATAVLVADIPFVAAPEPLTVMRSMCPLPILVARCRTHRSGYVEVETAKPQMLEMHDIAGLFRLDDTTYGIPFASLAQIEHLDGFIWEGDLPQLDTGPKQLPPMPAKLSTHVTEDLRRLVDALAAYRTQVVVWDSGLGRRVLVLAALVALDAFPALVVCRPDRVWQWWRHAALFSRTRGVDADDADLRVITYAEFVANPALAYGAQTLIFDDVASTDADTPEVAAAAVGIGGMLDCYLVGIADTLPEEPKQLASVMARLRPAEFSTAAALADRYGNNVRTGLYHHVSAYLSRRTHHDAGGDRSQQAFNHTQVHRVELSDELHRELAVLRDRVADPGELVLKQRETVSAGSTYTLSPKIAITVGMASDAIDAGRRVAVVTDYRRTSSLLAGLLRDHAPEVIRPTAAGYPEVPQARLVLVEGMNSLPNLSWFDEVIVVDYPSSYGILDTAVGHPDADYAPSLVTLLHAAGTIDDQLAVFAARNEERLLREAAKADHPAAGTAADAAREKSDTPLRELREAPVAAESVEAMDADDLAERTRRNSQRLATSARLTPAAPASAAPQAHHRATDTNAAAGTQPAPQPAGPATGEQTTGDGGRGTAALFEAAAPQQPEHDDDLFAGLFEIEP